MSSYDDTSKFGLQGSEPERNASPTLGDSDEGKKEGDDRIVVRIIQHRCRFLDEDNAKGGSKFLVDCLQKSGLIPSDSPKDIRLQVEQTKVSHRWEEKTVVEIENGNR